MSFFKNLFGKKDEPFVPTPTQEIPGLEPIVVHVIENLFPDTEVQKQAFNFSLKYLESRNGNTLNLLGALSSGVIDIDAPQLNDGKFWLDIMYPDFANMKSAKKWAKSITKSHD